MKAFDVSKFRKSVTKNISGITIGFHDPTTWISTGNFGLNYLLSNRFDGGVPLGKVTIFAGESGSGKSFICAGNLIKNAQDMGIFCVLLDSENALDETWLKALDVDTDENKLMKINVSMINDVAAIINDFMKDYKKTYAEVDKDERPKVLFVVDSLGMLLTPIDLKQFEDGDMKGNMGWTAKQLKALVKNCVVQFGEWDIGLVGTNHTYASQDMFNPDDKIAGGSGPIFAASQVVAMKKLKLKEDIDGKKVVTGITASIKVVKSRFSKPFEAIKIKIPYDEGMNPYSGLFELFVKKGILVKPSGNKYIYTDRAGNERKYFEKGFNRNDDGILDLIMNEWNEMDVEMATVKDEDNG